MNSFEALCLLAANLIRSLLDLRKDCLDFSWGEDMRPLIRGANLSERANL
jgi:hypothetical protein